MPNSLFWVIRHSPVPWQLAREMTQSTNLLIICSYLYMLTLVANVFWQGCFISVARNPIWNNIHHVKAAKATWGTTQAVVRYELHFTLAWSPCGERKRGMCAVMETIATIFHYLLVQLSDMDKYYTQKTNKKNIGMLVKIAQRQLLKVRKIKSFCSNQDIHFCHCQNQQKPGLVFLR